MNAATTRKVLGYMWMDAVSHLRPKSIAATLAGIATLLLAAHLVVRWLDPAFNLVPGYRFSRLFVLGVEENLPTLFAVLLWVICALLLLLLWRVFKVGGRRRVTWLMLSVVFAALSFDEFAHIHERFAPALRVALDTSGPLHYAWVVPYGIGIVVLALLVIPLLMKIKRSIRFWFLAAAAVFVTGSLGLEMIEGWQEVRTDGHGGTLTFVLVTIEEYLEMIGLIMLVYASLLLLHEIHGNSSTTSDIHLQ